MFFITCYWPDRYVNCNAFGYASKLLITHLKETLYNERPAAQLTELRHLWVDLSQMMQQLVSWAQGWTEVTENYEPLVVVHSFGESGEGDWRLWLVETRRVGDNFKT